MRTGRSEYCQFDEFEASCERDEVIIVETAQYGRMRSGRCISGEGYIGCSADVRVYLDGHCSGPNTHTHTHTHTQQINIYNVRQKKGTDVLSVCIFFNT